MMNSLGHGVFLCLQSWIQPLVGVNIKPIYKAKPVAAFAAFADLFIEHLIMGAFR